MTGTAAHSVQSEFSYQLLELADEDDFVDAASTMLASLFPSDGVIWNCLDLASGSARLRGTPVELESTPVSTLLAAHAGDHPIIQSYLRSPVSVSSPRRMSDVATHTALLRTGSYMEVLRPLRIRFQLSIMTTRDSELTGSGWCLSRSLRDFTDDEVELSAAVQAVLSLLVRRPGPRRSPPAGEEAQRIGLTAREQQVLCLIAEGHTAQRVGRVLRIAPTTVRKHLERVYAKLGAHDRLLAVSRARSLGLLGPESELPDARTPTVPARRPVRDE